MKLIWNSSTPHGTSGYGNITRELVSRLVNAGHKVSIATKHWHFGWYEWMKDVEIFEGLHLDYVSNMIEREGFDYIISCWDIWGLHSKRHFPKNKWIAYTPIDTEWIAQRYAEVLLGKDMPPQENRGPGICIAMSKHGSRELESIGIKSLYAPVGVDANIFKPDPWGRTKHRDAMKVDDSNFVIGSVGLNYSDDRKGFIQLLTAFKEFVRRHPEARLYLHTHAEGRLQNTLNFVAVSNYLGLCDIDNEKVVFAHQESIDLDRITPDKLNTIYNGFDVFCSPNKGEGFGMPMVEAAACGVPVIATDSTTGPEFHDAGIAPWLISVDELDDKRWMPHGTFRMEPRPSEVLKALECAYQAWKYSDWTKIKEGVHKAAQSYDWNLVWEKNWLPILNVLESNIKEKGMPNV